MENYEDFTKLILESLMLNQRDYCFNLKELKEIISECKKQNVSIIYKIKKNIINEIEYIELIPVKFYNKKTKKEINSLQIEYEDVKDYHYIILDKDDNVMRKRYGIQIKPKIKKRKNKKEWNNFNLKGSIITF